jgi:MFS family permease
VSPASYPQRWKALGVLALSLFVVTVGNTILNVGLPTIGTDLGASASQLQWIVDGYLLVFAVRARGERRLVAERAVVAAKGDERDPALAGAMAVVDQETGHSVSVEPAPRHHIDGRP